MIKEEAFEVTDIIEKLPIIFVNTLNLLVKTSIPVSPFMLIFNMVLSLTKKLYTMICCPA